MRTSNHTDIVGLSKLLRASAVELFPRKPRVATTHDKHRDTASIYLLTRNYRNNSRPPRNAAGDKTLAIISAVGKS